MTDSKCTYDNPSTGPAPAGTLDTPRPADPPRRTRRLIQAVGVFGVLALVWNLFGSVSTSEAQDTNSSAAPATASVVRKDLAEETTLDGAVTLADPRSIVAADDGLLVSLAEEGDTVERGEPIYLISDEPTAVELVGALAELEANESQLASGRADAEDVTADAKGAELAEAQAAIASAQLGLNDLVQGAESGDLASASASVAAAQKALADVLESASTAVRASAQAQVSSADAAVVAADGAMTTTLSTAGSAQANYCGLDAPPVSVCSSGDLPLSRTEVVALGAAVSAALADGDPHGIVAPTQALITAQVNYDNAVANLKSAEANQSAAQRSLDELDDPPSSASLDQVRADLDAALAQQRDLFAGADNHAIIDAQSKLNAAQAGLGDLLDGATAAELSAATESVNSAAAALELARTEYTDLIDSLAAPVLLYGHRPMSRVLEPGVTGEDVAQLQANLLSLGFDAGGALAVTSIYDSATTAAVTAWQASLGVLSTGTVQVDEVVFMPGPIQVDTWSEETRIGAPVTDGTPLAEVSVLAAVPVDQPPSPDAPLAPTQQVVADLPLTDRALLTEGDSVTIQLPDDTELQGVVEFISSVTLSDEKEENTWVEVTVTPQEAIPELWTGAEVDVLIVSELAEDVLAVPVTALVALIEGGYAVEVVPSGASEPELVGVSTGMFGDGLVEIEGEGLSDGMTVVVPE